jgi:steroid delta-isomerase-like uncharacterized protein
MSAEENKALVRRMLEEGFNEGNLDLADELYAPDYVYHEPGTPELPPGPEGVKQLMGMYKTAFPDAHITVEDVICEGDKVVARFTARGTHLGELAGIAASGNQVEVAGISVNRIENGRIAEEWECFDALGMMQQIGAIPAPEAAEA